MERGTSYRGRRAFEGTMCLPASFHCRCMTGWRQSAPSSWDGQQGDLTPPHGGGPLVLGDRTGPLGNERWGCHTRIPAARSFQPAQFNQ
ncbi:hypothetical protein C8T65DRAFT_654695 [Cerioporus squamosus]|nr:hypothetical protein C8T65DRAFT_654695 [Cerioporus squamosus]